ncbi:type II secretion system F family protein [Jannaschia sp. Os4]|uniref:type II secretion system F family protein n=1 Tax=Jannaschia sp. Os4 TaxID=2807617 RepID=UPI00193A9BBC|nr:type II secretion system F family protein [Jannaschia sp. Os4]MBM2574851.1 type II secretion system F family protein [Jannaschia sp. Os4]
MQHLEPILAALTGPDALIFGAGAAGILMAMIAIPLILRRRIDPMERLRVDQEQASAAEERLNRYGAGNQILAKYAKMLEPEDKDEMSKSRMMMIRAGYPHKDAVRTLHAAQLVLGMGLLSLGVLYVLVLAGEQPMHMTVLYALGPGVVGYYGPKYWLGKRIAKRQEEIQAAFPDALDLLLVCVEAGQSLDQSILRVATEMEPTFPALAGEFLLVAQEMKAGKDKPDVLRAMAERCDIQDISSFVTVLIQSASFGTSISDALRVYAGEMRDKRVMRAEEKANVLPTKLTVGTMMFCVPPLLIILIGPSIHGIATQLGGGAGF